MARITVRKSYIDVVGRIWLPAVVCSLHIPLSAYDVDNMQSENEDGSHGIDREDVEQWLSTHSGDFQEVIDFRASIEYGDETIDLDWATEDGETQYLDTLSGPDDDEEFDESDLALGKEGDE